MKKTIKQALAVSIVVPVYNAEKYLNRCLDSLIGQTLKNIEIIVVNDGSTDNSEAICRAYADKDARIVLICKKNGGLASARQMGLAVSRGEFFCTCDADDWVEPEMYEHLYNKAIETGADIIMCDYWKEYTDGRRSLVVYGKPLDSGKDLLEDLLNGEFPPAVWNKMFKKDLFEKNGISWKPGIDMGEDYLLMLKILQHDIMFTYLPSPLYHYRREFAGNSYTNNITIESFAQMMYICDWAEEHLDKIKYSNGLFCCRLNLCFSALRVMEGISGRDYRNNIVNRLSYRDFFKYRYRPKLKGLIVFFAKLFGYKIAAGICRATYKYIHN